MPNSTFSPMVEELQNRVDALVVDRDKWRHTAIEAAGRSRISMVMNGILLGVIAAATIIGYFFLSGTRDFQDSLKCRAEARVSYDAVRDKRDDLFAEGLVASVTDDQATLQRIDKELTPIRGKIRNGPTLPELYERAGCN